MELRQPHNVQKADVRLNDPLRRICQFAPTKHVAGALMVFTPGGVFAVDAGRLARHPRLPSPIPDRNWCRRWLVAPKAP